MKEQQQQQQQQEQQSYDGYNNNTNITRYNNSNSSSRRRRRKGRQQLQQQMWILFSILIIIESPQAYAADLVINVPSASSNDNAFYRIDYSPPFGYPEPNTTIPASDIGKDIQFSHALPGTEYNFWLYYTNSTHRELLTWTVKITTAPDPPANLSVQLRSSKSAFITWKPPGMGAYSGYKIKIFGLTDVGYNRTHALDSNDTLQLSAKELTPGGTYQVQAYTIYQAKESVAYTSRNFTTSKSRSMGGTRSPNSKCNF